MNEIIIAVTIICISIVLFKMSDVIKHYMTIKAKERSDAEYVDRKKKEKEELEKYNSREEQVKRQYGSNLVYWFTFNGKHFWHDKDVFSSAGVGYCHSKSAIRDKIIKCIDNFKDKTTDYYVTFWEDKKNNGVIHWEYIAMKFEQDNIKEVKTIEQTTEETLTKFNKLLTDKTTNKQE